MIKLYKNNAYKWFEKNGVYTIGYAFYNEELYEDNELTNLVYNMKNKIINEINKMTGYFAIVVKNEKETIIISDIIRSFPVFYTKKGDVTDDIELLRGELDELSIKELLHCRWISNDDTIYKNVKQIENSQIVIIKDGNVTKEKYFEYKYLSGKEYSFKQLDDVFQEMTNKMIKYLNGKVAVVPLSGGHDSRLLLYYLKKSNYRNIITYTYGNKNSEEVTISQKVAEFLQVPWNFIEYKKNSCRKKYNKKGNFSEVAKYFGRGYSIPHIQEWEAVDILIKQKKIDNNSVIIPGFTLDFLSGSHLYLEHIENDMLPKDIIKEKIYINNYNLTKKSNEIFNNKLEKKLNINFNKDRMIAGNVAKLYEQYDFEERQAKFITNAVRTYDYYGLKWYLPYWDKDVIRFWNRVSLKDRYQRKYLIDFEQYKYPELMEYAPIYKKTDKKKKLNILDKIYYIIYNYYNNSLNFYYYFTFRKYLKYAIIEKNFSYDYFIAKDYEKFIRRKDGI